MEFYPYTAPEKYSRSFFEDLEDFLESTYLKTPNLFEAIDGLETLAGKCSIEFSGDRKCESLLIGTDSWGSCVVASAVDVATLTKVGSISMDGYRLKSPIFALPDNQGYVIPICFVLSPFEAVFLAQKLFNVFEPKNVTLFTGLRHAELFTVGQKHSSDALFVLQNEFAATAVPLPFLPPTTCLPLSSSVASGMMQAASANKIGCICFLGIISNSPGNSDFRPASYSIVGWQDRIPKITVTDFNYTDLKAAFADLVSIKSTLPFPSSFANSLDIGHFVFVKIEGHLKTSSLMSIDDALSRRYTVRNVNSGSSYMYC